MVKDLTLEQFKDLVIELAYNFALKSSKYKIYIDTYDVSENGIEKIYMQLTYNYNFKASTICVDNDTAVAFCEKLATFFGVVVREPR